MKSQDEDHVPKNIRAQHRRRIRGWEQDQTTFLETRATRHILESLPLFNCIVVTGSSGCGKSSNIHHTALHLRDSFGYEVIPVITGPTDIINYYNENKKQVFVVDDICGKETINIQTLQTWRDYTDVIEETFKIAEKDVAKINDGMIAKVSSPKLLISCRLHIYKESHFQRITLFTKKECNLLSSKLCLLQEERMQMLHKYLPDDIIEDLKQVTENVDYFPLICELSKDKTSEEVKKLFTAPLKSIKENINNIINENTDQFCALVLCIVFNDGFDTDWLKLGSVSEKKNKKICKLLHIVKEFDIDLCKEKHRNSLKSCFSTLNGTFFKLRGTYYRMIHDKIYKMAAVICGQHLTECFMKYAPPESIRDHFIFESLTKTQKKDDSIVLLKDQEEDYFERLLCDLKEHVITSTFHNSQLLSQTFRDKLISFLRRSDDAKTVLEKLDREGCSINNNQDELEYKDKKTHFYTTPLIESVATGYIDIVQFLIGYVKCDVNNTDSEDSSSLYIASKRGHSAVTKLLLENNADISQCSVLRESPLYVACERGHTDTAEMLLQNKADVCQCSVRRESPLYVASKGGHKDTVELLLQYKADVYKCNKNEESPLYVACKEGHKDTVELLLQNKADVSKCNIDEGSPLYVASKRGHTDIVELLLQNKADESKYTVRRWSPLYVACKRGHKDTVKLLLQNKADVFQCSNSGESPLYVACKGGHTDIVKLLLQNKVDVSQCDICKWSPLHVACSGGHKDTVKLLLQNKANTSQCSFSGMSPLYVACKEGHTDTVELLLQNKADVFQCDDNSESSLYVASKGGHKDTVELLLQYKADVYKCNKSGESPLYVACKEGHKGTVELLLQNKADVSQCSISGMSPLYVACKEGHKDTVELLLQNNADVSQCDDNSESPLHVACKGGHTDIVILLLQNNADVSQLAIARINLLCMASKAGHTDTVELLLQNKVDVNQCNEYGCSPLFLACEGGYEDTVELLLQYNADVKKCDNRFFGESPLHVACKGGHANIVELILKNNANVSQCDSRGWSPLHAVCSFQHGFEEDQERQLPPKKNVLETVKILLEWNADVKMQNKTGQTPLDFACRSKFLELENLLNNQE